MNTKMRYITLSLGVCSLFAYIHADIKSDVTTTRNLIFSTYKGIRSTAMQLAIAYPEEALFSTKRAPFVDAQNKVNSFVTRYADKDSDLIRPWNTIVKEHNSILAAILDWQKVLASSNINNALIFMAKQDAKNILKSVANIEAARNRVNKTIFIRSNKKETAQIIIYFGGFAMDLGTFVARCLNNLRMVRTQESSDYIPEVPSRIPESPDYMPDVPTRIPQPPVRK